MKIEDYGKIAATFVDIKNGQAVRLHPAMGARELARTRFPEEPRAYFAQLIAYQTIPDHQLLSMQRITLNRDLQQVLGSPRQRAYCVRCGEEILNGHEVMQSGMTTCMACAGHAYYQVEQTIGFLNNSLDKVNSL